MSDPSMAVSPWRPGVSAASPNAAREAERASSAASQTLRTTESDGVAAAESVTGAQAADEVVDDFRSFRLQLRTLPPPQGEFRLAGDALAEGTTRIVGNPTDLVEPRFHMEIPDDLNGRAPNMNDVKILKGFDGRSPEEARAVVRELAKSPIARENEDLFGETTDATLKRFTVAVNNAFSPGPTTEFLNDFPDGSVTVIGNMSAFEQVYYRVDLPGEEPRYFKFHMSGAFVESERPPLPIVETPIRRNPPGVAVSYREWDVPGLAGRIGFVEEL